MTSPLLVMRWIPVRNTDASIVPAYGLLTVVDKDPDGTLQVQAPTSDSQQGLLVNSGSDIPAGAKGIAHNAFPASVLYDATSGTPAAGDAWGSKSGSFLLAKGNTGFVAESVGSSADGGLVVVQPIAAPSGFSRQTFSDADYTVTGSADAIVAQTGSLSAAREVTLPAASGRAGQIVIVVDESGSATSVKTIKTKPGGADTVRDFIAANPFIVQGAERLIFESDGVSQWTLLNTDHADFTRQTFSNADYTVTGTADVIVAQVGTLSVHRFVTLPSPAGRKGQLVMLVDESETAAASKEIIPVAGSGSIAAPFQQINRKGQSILFESDGVSQWTVVCSGVSVEGTVLSGSFGSINTLRFADGAGSFLVSATGSNSGTVTITAVAASAFSDGIVTQIDQAFIGYKNFHGVGGPSPGTGGIGANRYDYTDGAGAGLGTGQTGTLGPGAAAGGGVITNLGSGSFGSVTSVGTGQGLVGGPVTTSGTISLSKPALAAINLSNWRNLR